MAIEAAWRFIPQPARCSEAMTGALDAFSVDVHPSLDPRFIPDLMTAVRVKGRNEDFSRIGVNPKRAFDPVPNVVNTESVLFDDTDVGSRMVEVMTLPRDRHMMCHREETTEEFAEKLCESLRLVSHLMWYYLKFLLFSCFV